MTNAFLSTDKMLAEHSAAPLKQTKGLAKEFPGRVFEHTDQRRRDGWDAIGAAINGMRPIVEMQFADFSSTALNQILNNAGTHYWRTNVPVRSRCRLPSGGTKAAGRFTASRWNRSTRIIRD